MYERSSLASRSIAAHSRNHGMSSSVRATRVARLEPAGSVTPVPEDCFLISRVGRAEGAVAQGSRGVERL